MKEFYSEDLASHTGPESYADRGNPLGVATARGILGPVIESRYVHRPACRPARTRGRQHPMIALARSDERGGACELWHGWKLQTRQPGDPIGLLDLVTESGSETSLRATRYERCWGVR